MNTFMGFFKRTLGTLFTIKKTDPAEMTPDKNKAEFKKLIYYVCIFFGIWIIAAISKRCSTQENNVITLQEKIDSLEMVIQEMKDTTKINTPCE